jgi:hypothetical protein
LYSAVQSAESKLNDAYAALYEAEQKRDSRARDVDEEARNVSEERRRLEHYQALERTPEVERDVSSQGERVRAAEGHKEGADLLLYYAKAQAHERDNLLQDAKTHVQNAKSNHESAVQRVRTQRHIVAERCH